MANVLTTGEAYDPFFYANEALRQLNKVLGMARMVFRGFDRTPQDRGSVIKLRRPGKFDAQAMPIALGSATDITPDYIQIDLDQWFGTMFRLTDKELSATRERIIDEHLGPLAIGVADKIDQGLVELLDDVPWFHPHIIATPFQDFPDVRKIMFENLNPGSNRRYGIGASLQNAYEKDSVFVRVNEGADGAALQREGLLTRKFGFDIFANQNFGGRTGGGAADLAGTISGAHVRTATSISLAGLGAVETFEKGASFVIAGNTQRYALSAQMITDGGGLGTATIEAPGLVEALVGGEVVTLRDPTLSERGVAFHPEAFALAMVPLSSLGDGAGARIGTAVDPITGMALRSTIFYDPGTAQNFVRIDALWGRRTLDQNLAVNVEFT